MRKLNSIAFEHPWLSGLVGDPIISELLGANASLKHMLAVEACYMRALGAVGRVSLDEANQASDLILNANIDPADLLTDTALDGVVVPALVRRIRQELPEPLSGVIHSGMTSQDVIDTAFVLGLRDVLDSLECKLKALIGELDELMSRFGGQEIMGRTRMQAALPTSAATRISAWRQPLVRHQDRLIRLRSDLLQIQLGGPVGDQSSLKTEATAIEEFMAGALGLGIPKQPWHTTRDQIVEFANWLSMVTGTLGKLGADIALMAQQGIGEVGLNGGGGSSAMPHKQNPIRAEILISLATFNGAQLSGMQATLLHEQERSGSAWTLEWLLLPQMMIATGSALSSALALCGSIETIGQG